MAKQRLADKALFRCHSFALPCAQNDIDHCMTNPDHPWTDGQVERMNRTIKDTTVRRHPSESHDRLRAHLKTFLDAYNVAKRLNRLNGLTVFESLSAKWAPEPERFRLHPDHLTARSNS
ncbi:MAG: integrase core domain-containing protein [Pseudomonadota bacterium]